MGEALDREGRVLGEATGATKQEVFNKLIEKHPTAHEIRIKSIEERMAQAAAGTPVRTLTDHHDGHGLNESITITTDDPDQSGAAHYFEAMIGDVVAARVQFQRGPRNEPGSTPGMTEAAMLVTMIDRLRGFQAGPYACRENAIILTKLEECLFWTKARADARAKRGVLGKNQK